MNIDDVGHCRVTACRRRIGKRWLFCGKHWRRVPLTLQDAINLSLAQAQRTPPGDERDARCLEYLQAVIAAAEIAGEMR